ncbi:zinc-dependent peptidase [Aquiflexum sp.]|uniref:zinc-dependent peptidase n=1 Tax=Aquiflexum sp. TaxID=1872584 RepID=UPI0035945913
MFRRGLIFTLFGGLINLGQELLLLLKIKSIHDTDIHVLEKNFSYFRKLNPKHKKEFKRRLARFLAQKKMIPRGGLKQATREMQLLIGATAVMVTFGFRGVSLKHFKKILIYPDNYFSTINQQYHQGEVNPKLGVIVLSWRNFAEGFMYPNDGVNLGIHEMAHALKLENQIHYNRESNFFNPDRWETYAKLAAMEIRKIQSGEASIFRPSAGKNSHEFFAVALETFFEKSAELKGYNQEFYQALVFLLKQDPLVLGGKEKSTL